MYSLKPGRNMSLIAALVKAKSEEDVKDAYIKALGLKSITKGLIDIRTNEVWFEAKDASTPPVLMFVNFSFMFVMQGRRGNISPHFWQ